MTSPKDTEESTESPSSPAVLAPEFASAFAARGYTSLSMVQEAVLAPELRGRDLRISSQTGSGKTVAIGLAMRDILGPPEEGAEAPKGPLGLVIAPTRELAKQVEEELGWLYGAIGVKVISLVGGSSVRDERRALSMNPAVIVGTPGRLLDHQRKGALRTEWIRAVVLDEADRMLDMGFREDIEALFAAMPSERRTHLVSATFPREVKALAARIQKDFAVVEGTPLGAANADIEHIIHLCHSTERLNAVVNLLLKARLEEVPEPGRVPDATLIFARTRADVADVSRELQKAGFRVGALSGELEQAARNRALDAFKTGMLDALVATDVAARGIDAQNVARVIHGDPPADPDTYTHRSGRTGRAGRKGQSILLVAPVAYERVTRLLSRAKVVARVDPLPTREDLLDAQDKRWLADLTDEHSEQGPDERTWALAKRIVREADVTRALARLLHHAEVSGGRTRPREIAPVNAPRGMRQYPAAASEGRYDRFEPRLPRPQRADGPRYDAPRTDAPSPRYERKPERAPTEATDWVTFHVTWGEAQGADPRRLVAMACRRGNIQGTDIGAIRVGRTSSTIDVSAHVARAFGDSVAKPDPRDPRIAFGRSPGGAPPPRAEAGDPGEIPEVVVPAPRASKPRVTAPGSTRSVVPDRPSRPVAIRPDRPSKPAAAKEKPAAAHEDRPKKPYPQKPGKPYPGKPGKPYPGKGGKPYAAKPAPGKAPPARPSKPAGEELPKRRRDVTLPKRP